MELGIKVEICEDGKYAPLCGAECRINIDQSDRYWSSDILLGSIFRHLCHILSADMKIIIAKAE